MARASVDKRADNAASSTARLELISASATGNVETLWNDIHALTIETESLEKLKRQTEKEVKKMSVSVRRLKAKAKKRQLPFRRWKSPLVTQRARAYRRTRIRAHLMEAYRSRDLCAAEIFKILLTLVHSPQRIVEMAMAEKTRDEREKRITDRNFYQSVSFLYSAACVCSKRKYFEYCVSYCCFNKETHIPIHSVNPPISTPPP